MFLSTCSSAGYKLHCMVHWSDIRTHKLVVVHMCTDWLCPLPPTSAPCTSASDTALPCLCHSRKGCGAELFSASGGASGAVSHTGLEWRQCWPARSGSDRPHHFGWHHLEEYLFLSSENIPWRAVCVPGWFVHTSHWSGGDLGQQYRYVSAK